MSTAKIGSGLRKWEATGLTAKAAVLGVHTMHAKRKTVVVTKDDGTTENRVLEEMFFVNITCGMFDFGGDLTAKMLEVYPTLAYTRWVRVLGVPAKNILQAAVEIFGAPAAPKTVQEQEAFKAAVVAVQQALYRSVTERFPYMSSITLDLQQVVKDEEEGVTHSERFVLRQQDRPTLRAIELVQQQKDAADAGADSGIVTQVPKDPKKLTIEQLLRFGVIEEVFYEALVEEADAYLYPEKGRDTGGLADLQELASYTAKRRGTSLIDEMTNGLRIAKAVEERVDKSAGGTSPTPA